MRCSGCSQPIRPVVALDIDGTLADYHTAFHNFCRGYWDLHEAPDPAPWGCGVLIGQRCSYDGSNNFEDHIGITKAQYREAKLAYRQGGNKRWLTAYAGSHELVKAIHAAGAELWVCTTRPWNSLSNIDPDTQEWLRRQGFEVDGLLYGDSKYQQLVEAVDKDRVVGCVEDLAEQFDMARALSLPVIQVARDHNGAATQKRVPRGTLDLVQAWVLHQIEDWRDTYVRS